MCPSVLEEEEASGVPHACCQATPSTSNDSCQAALELKQKSAKRRAAEALLQRRFSSNALDSAAASSPATAAAANSSGGRATKRQRAERPAVRVAACSDCSGSCCSGQAAAADEPGSAWCAQDVALPPMDWPTVLQSVSHDSEVQRDEDGKCYCLPGGIRVHVVARADQLYGALRALRASMQDSCIGIDLEWRPEGWKGAGPTKVALMQLATSSVAVLVRFSHMGWIMPPHLRAFLSDPTLTFIGFSWDSSDEVKMQQTFGAGRRELFARFHDMQQVASSLGYHGLGLGGLTRRVLGSMPPKCRKVTMSNWEARQLSAKQLQYAALDAVCTVAVYRGLRLWHSSPSACTSCRQMLGTALPQPDWRCVDCDKSFQSSAALMCHQNQKQHKVVPSICQECGRVQTTTA